MNILNVGYASTNYYLIEPDRVGLLVDIGWSGTMGRLNSVLKRKGVAFEKIRYLLATHSHPDHAGLAQEMKDRGVRLIVMDTQVEWIPKLARIIASWRWLSTCRSQSALMSSSGNDTGSACSSPSGTFMR